MNIIVELMIALIKEIIFKMANIMIDYKIVHIIFYLYLLRTFFSLVRSLKIC